MNTIFNKINTVSSKILKTVMAISSLLLFIVTFLQVVARFIFKSPLPWSQDIIRLCFVYLVFWGAAYCLNEKTHLNVDVFLNSIKVGLRKYIELLINIALLFFAIFIIYFGFRFVISGASQNAPYIPVPMSIYYLSVPTSAIFMVYSLITQIVEQIQDIKNYGISNRGGA